MATARKIVRRSLGLFALGYGLGILTAPRSGKQTRGKIKKTTNDSINSVTDIEKDLKKVYSQTKEILTNFSKENPTLNAKLKKTVSAAQKSQSKVKDLLSAIHGQDNVDDDLSAALKNAKKSLDEIKKYIKK
jgi:gas vesicle protein